MMRVLKSALFIAPVVALALAPARDAAACGGCFHNDIMQMENTQVTGHRMILSVSKTQSTLWDQISYMGKPSSFAWVLPIKGMVDVGVSSDALFGNLEQMTQVTINSPTISCPPPQICSAAFAGANGTGGGNNDAGVTVLAEQVVGPYETAQLSSMDPAALTKWLMMHNYVIPPDIDPIISAYVSDGFDFLAIKLVDGKGLQSMKPIRVTSQGASPVLPLRMVAAGTGANVPITLWVIGEGAYVPSPPNFTSFTITEDQLVWDWTTMMSNYKTLRQDQFTKSGGKAWLVEAAEPISQFYLLNSLTDLAMYDPSNSGYADDMGMNAPANCAADLAALFAGISDPATWVSRLHGELPRAALATDLNVMASPNQTPVQQVLTAQKTTGTPPSCPPVQPCGGSSGMGGAGGGGAGGDGSSEFGGCSGNCAIGSPAEGAMPIGLGVLALSAISALRRRQRRAKN